MKVTIELFASFRDGRFKRATWELAPRARVSDIITELGIVANAVGVVLVNGRHVDDDRVLGDGDRCAIFPLLGGG